MYDEGVRGYAIAYALILSSYTHTYSHVGVMERGRGVQRCGAPRVLAPEGGPHLCAPKVEVHPPHPPTPLPKLSQRLGLGREVGG